MNVVNATRMATLVLCTKICINNQMPQSPFILLVSPNPFCQENPVFVFNTLETKAAIFKRETNFSPLNKMLMERVEYRLQ